MGFSAAYKSLTIEKEKKSFLKGYHLDFDHIHLFINLEITEFDFETEAHNIAESLLEILQKHLTENSDQSVYDRFEESLKEVNFLLNDLKSKKETGNIGKLNSIIGILEDKTLHLTKTGLAESYLLRKGNIIEISEGLYNQKGNDQNYFTNIASGDLEMGDKVLLSSKRLLKFIGKSDLTSMFLTTSAIDDSFQELKNSVSMEEIGDIIVNGFVVQKDEEMLTISQQEPEPEEMEKKEEKKTGMSLAKGREILGNVVKGTPGMVAKVASDVKDPSKRRNYIIVLIVAVITILFVSITSMANNKTTDSNLKKYEQVLQSANDKLADARQQKIYDGKLAKLSLNEAKKKAIEVLDSGVYWKDAKQLIQDIEKEAEMMDKINRIDNPLVLVDLSKKDAGTNAIEIVHLNQAFYVITSNSVLGPIVDSTPDSYAKTSIENGELFISADKFQDREDLVMLTKSNKVVEFKDNTTTFMDTEDTLWHSGIDVKTYSGRQYIYILDPANNNIWKYERTSKKYRGASGYNTDNVDLKDAVSFAIDGNIYVLKANGEVVKIYAQKKQPFTVESGPSIPLANLDTRAKIVTNEILRSIYILDPSNERVLVYKKISFENPEKMTYDRQYVFKDQDLRDIYIDDLEQNLFVLTAQKILKVDIKGIQ